jgi:hypothetical protein
VDGEGSIKRLRDGLLTNKILMEVFDTQGEVAELVKG